MDVFDVARVGKASEWGGAGWNQCLMHGDEMRQRRAINEQHPKGRSTRDEGRTTKKEGHAKLVQSTVMKTWLGARTGAAIVLEWIAENPEKRMCIGWLRHEGGGGRRRVLGNGTLNEANARAFGSCLQKQRAERPGRTGNGGGWAARKQWGKSYGKIKTKSEERVREILRLFNQSCSFPERRVEENVRV